MKQTEKLYAGDDTTGKVYQLDTGTSFDGEAIESYIKSATLDLGNPALMKSWRDVDAQFRNSQATLTVELIVDGETYRSKNFAVGTTGQVNGIGVNYIGEDVIGLDGFSTNTATTTNVVKRIRGRMRGKTLQVKVSNTSSTDTWTLMSLRGAYRPLSRNIFNSHDKL
jgi:hypothetical protein